MSTGIKKYGSTQAELDAGAKSQCRDIVRVIMQYGVSEQQLLKIIYLLSLELSNRGHLQQISNLVKRLESGDLKQSTLITNIE